MRVTRPTSTPDIETCAPALRSPTLSNMAVTSYIGCDPNEKWRLLICVNKKASDPTPSSTNPPAPRMVLSEYCMRPPCCPPAGSIMRYQAQHCDQGRIVCAGQSGDFNAPVDRGLSDNYLVHLHVRATDLGSRPQAGMDREER